MSPKQFSRPLAILLVVFFAACSKSEMPANELQGKGEMEGTVQHTALASAVASAVVTDNKQILQSENRSAALSMAEGLALAQKNNCLACHMIDKKLVGPAWRDVAKRYKGVEGIEHRLVIKVSTGGAGNWGDMPMPAMAPDVKEEDIRALVRFVLSLEK